jgi:hypothetical protein
MKRRCALLLVLAISLPTCSKSSSSPTAPSPTASATRVIGVTGALDFGSVLVGQMRELTVTISNTGTGTLTLGDVSAPSSAASSLSATLPRTVAPGGSATATIRFAPQSAGGFSGTITFGADHTSGTNTIGFSGNGVVPTATVAGVVREAGTNSPLSGVSVRIVAGVGLNSTSVTDGNGYYSIAGVSGALTLSFSLSGFDSVARPTVVNGDTRFDTTLTRTGPPPASASCPLPPYMFDSNVNRCRNRLGQFALNECCGR